MNELEKNQMNAICKKVADIESENMKEGIETIKDYGFKCAVASFKCAFNINNLNFWEGFKAAIEMIDNQLINYESNELATMNCWDLIEKIREDLIENAELYKKDG